MKTITRKSGSEFVEAAIVLPLMILIIVGFIVLMAYFYGCLNKQCESQQAVLREAAESGLMFSKHKKINTYSSLPIGPDKQLLEHTYRAEAYGFDESALIRSGDFIYDLMEGRKQVAE